MKGGEDEEDEDLATLADELKRVDTKLQINWKVMMQETYHFSPQLRHAKTKKESTLSEQVKEPIQQKDIADQPLHQTEIEVQTDISHETEQQRDNKNDGLVLQPLEQRMIVKMLQISNWSLQLRL